MVTNDETIYTYIPSEEMPKSNTGQIQQPEQVQQPEKQAKDNNFAKRAAVLGAAVLGGGVLGGGAAYAMSSSDTEAGTANGDAAKIMSEADSKSFEDAFDDARLQMGPGAAFRWNGGVYSTYTADEWDKMSAEEKAAYSEKMNPLISDAERDSSHYTHQADTNDNYEAHVQTHHGNSHDDNHHDPQPKPQPVDESYHIDKEAVIEIDGKNYIAAEATHDGQKVVLLDSDNDGKYDIAVEDVNKDGHISDNEYIDVSHKGLAVQDTSLIEQTHVNDDPVVVVQNGTEELYTMDDGTKVIAGVATVGGKEGLVIDINKDGTYDVAYVDKNGNAQIDKGEEVNISSSGARVSDTSLVDGQVIATNDPHTHSAPDTMPDYVNNGIASNGNASGHDYEVTASSNTLAANEDHHISTNDEVMPTNEEMGPSVEEQPLTAEEAPSTIDDDSASHYNDMAFNDYDGGMIHGTDGSMMMDDGSMG